METRQPEKLRKPLLSIEVEQEEKDLFRRAAKSKRLSLSAWARTVMLDEARRLGIT